MVVGDRPDGVAQSADASSSSGTVVQAGRDAAVDARRYSNSGVHIGDVNLHTAVPVRTRYRHQVARIAPPKLVGRDAELAELAAFCSGNAGTDGYRWWRAGPWAGKSALLSWFVLHPPPGVRIVSFFVTARWAGQDNRLAFIDNVLEQLLAILGQAQPPFLTAFTRESHLLGLLAEAAEACRERGERFVLLVDGLDEDRGVTTGADAHSIAQLLPATLPAGMRVVVAGRPDPPIPTDVPEHHPLRDPAIVRVLAPSPEAQAVRADMERELKDLLGGSVAEQDLLGLVTAAGGGLTAADLSELTGWSTWQVADHLGTVTGRSFTRRDSHYSPGAAPESYVLGHEELQVRAREMLGDTRLAAYRDRLHTWADQYAARGWPRGTPEYLLRGYYNLLTAEQDTARMVGCATSRERQERLLDVSGGDSAALAEITAAQAALLAHPSPDLTALARLAFHRDRLTTRNTTIPVALPAMWAHLGHPGRAETLARSIPDRAKRDEALAHVVTALAGRVAEAAAIVATISTRSSWEAGFRALVAAATTPDDIACVLTLLRDDVEGARVTSSFWDACATLAGKALDAGLADGLAAAVPDPAERNPLLAAASLTKLRDAVEADRSDGEAVADLVTRATDDAAAVIDPERRLTALLDVLAVVSARPDRSAGTVPVERLVHRCVEAARAREDDRNSSSMLARIALAAAAVCGEAFAVRLLDEAVDHAGSPADPAVRAGRALGLVTTLTAQDGTLLEMQVEFVFPAENPVGPSLPIVRPVEPFMLDAAIRAARHVPAHARDTALLSIARAAKESGRPAVAASVLGLISSPARKLDAVASRVATPSGTEVAALLDQWTAAAREVEHAAERSQALTRVAEVADRLGRTDHAEALFREAANALRRGVLVIATAVRAARSGRVAVAKDIARGIGDPALRAEALVSVLAATAVRAARAGRPALADEFAREAVEVAVAVEDAGQRTDVVQAVLSHLVDIGSYPTGPRLIGDLDGWSSFSAREPTIQPDRHDHGTPELVAHAVEAARALPAGPHRDESHARLAAVAAGAGRPDLAAEAVRRISDPSARSDALSLVAQRGDHERSAGVLREAIDTAEDVADEDLRDKLLVRIAGSVGPDLPDLPDLRAEAARAVSDPVLRCRSLADLLGRAGAGGDPDLAVRLFTEVTDAARDIADDERRSSALWRPITWVLTGFDLDQRVMHLGSFTEEDPDVPAALPGGGATAALADAVGEDGADRLLGLCEQAAQAIPDPHRRSRAQVAVARAWFELGVPDRAARLTTAAESTARFTPDPYREGRGLVAAATATEPRRAAALIARAEVAARAIAQPRHRSEVSCSLAVLVARDGDADRAGVLLEEATDAARKESGSARRQSALEAVVAAAVRVCDLVRAAHPVDVAEVAARSVLDLKTRGVLLVRLAAAAARLGDTGRTARLTTRAVAVARRAGLADPGTDVPGPVARAMTTTLFDRLREVGEHGRAAEVLARAHGLARLTTDPVVASDVHRAVADALARAGELDRAEALALSIDARQRSWALLPVVEAAVEAGDVNRAERLAGLVEPAQRGRVLRAAAEAAARAGDLARAGWLARSIDNALQRAWAMRAVVDATGRPGRRLLGDLTEAVAAIPRPGARAAAWAGAATVALHVGDTATARTAFDRALEAASSATEPRDRAGGLHGIVQVVADTARGREEAGSWLQEVVHLIDDPALLVKALRTAVEAFGPVDWVRRAVASVADPDVRGGLSVLLAERCGEDEAARLMARVTTLVRWPTAVGGLAGRWPDAVTAIADELLVPDGVSRGALRP